MASKKHENKPAINPDLPEMLMAATEQAANILLPHISEEETEQIPTLFQFMTPMVVNDPRYKGDGKPPRVLREPLLMISWDKRLGAFKVNLSDKIFNLAGSISVQTLLGALLDTETSLRSNLFPWSQKKLT